MRRKALLVEDNLITREELSSALGITVGEIHRRELKGEFKPTKRLPKSGRLLYDKKIITKLSHVVGLRKLALIAEKKQTYRQMFDYTAEDSGRVYALFDEGKNIVQIVIETGLHPGVVRAISEEYAETLGSMFISGAVMGKINELPLDGNFPLTTGEDLLAVLEGCAATTCVHCHQRPKAICSHCAEAVAEKLAV